MTEWSQIKYWGMRTPPDPQLLRPLPLHSETYTLQMNHRSKLFDWSHSVSSLAIHRDNNRMESIDINKA